MNELKWVTTLQPFCVKLEGLSQEEAQHLLNLAVEAGASPYECVYPYTANRLEAALWVSHDATVENYYIGVDIDNSTVMCEKEVGEYNNNLLTYTYATEWLQMLITQREAPTTPLTEENSAPEGNCTNKRTNVPQEWVESVGSEKSEKSEESDIKSDSTEGHTSIHKQVNAGVLDSPVATHVSPLDLFLKEITEVNKHNDLISIPTSATGIINQDVLSTLEELSLTLQVSVDGSGTPLYIILDEDSNSWEVNNVGDFYKVVNAIKVLGEFGS